MLAESCTPVVLAVEAEDARAARVLAGGHRDLGARDLIHLAVTGIETFDRELAAAFGG